MRLLGVILCSIVLHAAEDPREIVRRAIDVDHLNKQAARDYAYVERQEQRNLDGAGKTARRESKTFEISVSDGAPYRRLVARDDKPLAGEELKKEQAKLDASIAATPEQRSARRAEWERKRQRFREGMLEVLDAFDLRLLGDEKIGDREMYVIEGTPKPDYRPHTQMGRYYPKLKGRLWIDKRDYFWVKAEAEVIDTISYGLILARIQKGTRFSAEQTRVNDEVWLPKRISASALARVALFKKMVIEWEATYRDYRKFQSDSRVVSSEPVAQPAP